MSHFCELSVSIYDDDMARYSGLVVGNEGNGIPLDVTDRVAARPQNYAYVHVPMGEGCESLNVGVAAGIVMYEMRRGEWT